MLQSLEIRYVSCRSRFKGTINIEVILSFSFNQTLSLHFFILSHSRRKSGHIITQFCIVFDSEFSFLSIILNHSLKQECLAIPGYGVCLEFTTVFHDLEIRHKVLLLLIVLHIPLVEAERLFVGSRHGLRLSEHLQPSLLVGLHDPLVAGFHGALGNVLGFELAGDLVVDHKFLVPKIFFESSLLGTLILCFISLVKLEWGAARRPRPGPVVGLGWFGNSNSIFTLSIISRKSRETLHKTLNFWIDL